MRAHHSSCPSKQVIRQAPTMGFTGMAEQARTVKLMRETRTARPLATRKIPRARSRHPFEEHPLTSTVTRIAIANGGKGMIRMGVVKLIDNFEISLYSRNIKLATHTRHKDLLINRAKEPPAIRRPVHQDGGTKQIPPTNSAESKDITRRASCDPPTRRHSRLPREHRRRATTRRRHGGSCWWGCWSKRGRGRWRCSRQGNR